MCTVSWINEKNTLEVFNNRDELRTRQPGCPPAIKNLNGTQYIAPTDADAGGTWIAVNEHGTVYSLLNNFPENPPVITHPESRGNIIPFHIAENKLPNDLRQFHPFTLLKFSPGKAVVRWDWNGEKMEHLPRSEPIGSITNSSFSTKEVIAYRQKQFDYLKMKKISSKDLKKYHLSQEPGDAEYAVRMERIHAHTVSISHLCITAEKISFTYYDIPPFTNKTTLCSLSRT